MNYSIAITNHHIRVYHIEMNDLRSKHLLTNWFALPLGQEILTIEHTLFTEMLPSHAEKVLHIGFIDHPAKLFDHRYAHQFTVDIALFLSTKTDEPTALPFDNDSMDLVVLAHHLEFSRNPHQLLREVDRVLREDGYLLITGFNPLSLFGIRRFFSLWQPEIPWNHPFISMYRLKDWLSLLSFVCEQKRVGFFRPPCQQPKLLEKLRFIEEIKPIRWQHLGGIYMILAKKQTMRLIHPTENWRTSIQTGLLHPAVERRS